jgi:sirohydrochlorin cobaltochelatase
MRSRPSSRTGLALVLAAHGSHRSAQSAAPVHAHAAAIRGLGIFDEVAEAFWKEEPSLRDALDIVESTTVVIVPLFLADGYFTRIVLPRELRRAATRGRDVRVAPPIGAHPAMAALVLRRAHEASGLTRDRRHAATLVIVGHGTETVTGSGDTVYMLRDALRLTREFRHVECGFLDQAPRLDHVLERASTRDIVLVPFFMSEGWHAGTTIPRDYGLADRSEQGETRGISYTPPVGTLPHVVDVIVDLAERAFGSALTPTADEPASPPGDEPVTPSTSEPAPVRARRDLLAWVDNAGPDGRALLQVRIRRVRSDTYELRHAADTRQDPRTLERHAQPEAALRIARTDDAGRHRPLRSSPDLRRGWVITDLSGNALWSALAWLYPTAVLRWHQLRARTLEPGSFDETAAARTGIYAGVDALTDDALRHVIRSCCGDGSCLRSPVWRVRAAGSAASLLDAGPAIGDAVVPCVDPCSLFVARAAEALRDSSAGEVT